MSGRLKKFMLASTRRLSSVKWTLQLPVPPIGSTVLHVSRQKINGRAWDDSLDCKSCKQFRCKQAWARGGRPLFGYLPRTCFSATEIMALGGRRRFAWGFRAWAAHRRSFKSTSTRRWPAWIGWAMQAASARERVAFASFRAFAFTWAFFVLRSD